MRGRAAAGPSLRVELFASIPELLLVTLGAGKPRPRLGRRIEATNARREAGAGHTQCRSLVGEGF